MQHIISSNTFPLLHFKGEKTSLNWKRIEKWDTTQPIRRSALGILGHKLSLLEAKLANVRWIESSVQSVQLHVDPTKHLSSVEPHVRPPNARNRHTGKHETHVASPRTRNTCKTTQQPCMLQSTGMWRHTHKHTLLHSFIEHTYSPIHKVPPLASSLISQP